MVDPDGPRVEIYRLHGEAWFGITTLSVPQVLASPFFPGWTYP